MVPLIVIRPEPGCSATVATAREMGLEAYGFPLFAVSPLEWEPPEPAAFDALLIGSANAIRHGGAELARFIGKPLYAVGEVTALMARDAGFTVVASGAGGLQSLLDGRIDPAHRRLLRLGGRERVSLTPPSHITLIERIVYASEPLPMPVALAGMLGNPCVVLLHSAEAARHFAHECARTGLSRGHLTLAAIGSRVTAAAGPGWASATSAEQPDETALLALARQLCQSATSAEQLDRKRPDA